ncbi:MAG: rhomboid family intramembrane serine protease [Candidatus Latescibacteria bacterium]|nr:rhomboid family intramembrane serine protease [Candidatus Latescibacterota bacterium]
MIPLKDDNPTYSRPVVTVGLIILNAIVFLFQLVLSPEAEQAFIFRTAAIPFEVTHFIDRSEIPIPGSLHAYPPAFLPFPLALFSAMFVHGGLMHAGGNMLYLWIFGNNIEDAMGHVRFVVFYLIAGLGASLAHVLADMNSTVPMIGASGAIAGVLGAYFVLFPRANVKTLVIFPFFFIFFRIIHIPAVILLGLWFLMQVLNSAGGGGGVAWYAHIGGFLVGMFLVRYFERPRPRRRWINPAGEWEV